MQVAVEAPSFGNPRREKQKGQPAHGDGDTSSHGNALPDASTDCRSAWCDDELWLSTVATKCDGNWKAAAISIPTRSIVPTTWCISSRSSVSTASSFTTADRHTS